MPPPEVIRRAGNGAIRLINRAARPARLELRPVPLPLPISDLTGDLDRSGAPPTIIDPAALDDLSRRYREFGGPAGGRAMWTREFVEAAVDVKRFRADNAYVWQTRSGETATSYALVAYYLRAIGLGHLLDRLDEDGAYGAHTVEVAGQAVSRDLLDSVLEVAFLDDHLDLLSRPEVSVLDIGAGYGRFAHRLTTLHPGATVWCTDAVALSTLLCDHYLRFRGVDRARTVPLDQVEAALTAQHIDLAVNIHSFSECALESVEWWVDLMARHRVPALFIVPNLGRLWLTATSIPVDFEPVLTRHGYRMVAQRTKYEDPAVQALGVQPTAYYLFELS
jgi:hypothetical protein